MTYRVAIIGAGENARDHGRACQHVKQTELVAVCDISEQALERFGEEFHVPERYTRLDEMLATVPLDIVIISTWGESHAAVCKAAAATRGMRAILVEKPISMTAHECEEMIAATRTNGVLLTEGFKFRYHPQHERVKQIIESGRIGQVKAVQATLASPLMRYAPLTNWRFNPRRGGGSIYDTASYLIHFARHVVGSEPEWAYAVGNSVRGSAAEVSAAVHLRFPGDVTAQLISSYEYGYCQSTAIAGTRGWIRMDLPFDQRSVREVEFVTVEELPAPVHVFCDNFDTETYLYSPVNQFDRQLEHLCECLSGHSSPVITPEFSLGNMRVIDAVFESMQTGQPVAIWKETRT